MECLVPTHLRTWLCTLVVLVGLAGERQAPSAQGPAIPDADDRAVAHVLNRLTFGARPTDAARVKSMGIAAFIERQLHPERIDNGALEARLDEFETLRKSSRELASGYFAPSSQVRRDLARQRPQPPSRPDAPASSDRAEAREAMTPEMRMALAAPQQVLNELMQAKLLRASFSERQLEEVLEDFWLNHFNVFIGKGQVRLYLPEYERDVIRPHVLGSFRELLGAVAHSPAMLIYLDNWQSAAPSTSIAKAPVDGRRRAQQPPASRQARGLNENYARELMELHTLGVDGGYIQQDVVELARILTGWTIDQPRRGGGFRFRPFMHDSGTKTLLGATFRASGEDEGERALDLLARHPSTARHVSFRLAQRFVADEPPVALVNRAATTFRNTHGNLRDVVRTIITSPEFFAPEAYRAKIKTPLEFVVSSVRATDASVASALPLVAALRNLGMPLYGSQPPTGYSTSADAWVNTGALLNRLNFAVSLVYGTLSPRNVATRTDAGDATSPGVLEHRQVARSSRSLHVDLSSIAPDTSERSRRAVVDRLLAGDVSSATRATLERAETPSHLVVLALGSPEFQRR